MTETIILGLYGESRRTVHQVVVPANPEGSSTLVDLPIPFFVTSFVIERGPVSPPSRFGEGLVAAAQAYNAALESKDARVVDLMVARRDLKGWIFMAGTAEQPGRAANPRPPVVTLCGSTRFMDEFFEAGWRETLAGKIVLSVGVSKHLPPDHGGESLGPDAVEALDQLHLRKIDLSDEVLVLNVGGYVGDSTANEIRYARRHHVPVRWLEPPTAEVLARTAPNPPEGTGS